VGNDSGLLFDAWTQSVKQDIPIVDAAMRALQSHRMDATTFRMIVASFFVNIVIAMARGWDYFMSS